MDDQEAWEWFNYFKVAQEGQPLYQRHLPKILRFELFAKPLLEEWIAAHPKSGGIKAATFPVLGIFYKAWLRISKLAHSLSLQTLASRGQLRTLDIDKVKVCDLEMSVPALEQHLDSPPPHTWTSDTMFTLPVDFKVQWPGQTNFVLPGKVKLGDVRGLPDYFEDLFAPKLGELAVVGDGDDFTVDSGREIWASGRAPAVEGRSNHVLFLLSGHDGPFEIIGFVWQEWADVKYKKAKVKGWFPTLRVYATRMGYTRKGFAQAALIALLQLPDVGAADHLCLRLHQDNSSSTRCLEKVGEKLGRTLHKVGVVGEDYNTKFREINDDDDLLECCLSRGPPSIFPTPWKPPAKKKKPDPEKNKGGRPKKAKAETD
jgi:hypothetical protein